VKRRLFLVTVTGSLLVLAFAGPGIVYADVGNDEADGGSGKDRIFGEGGDDQKGASEAGLGAGLDGNSEADRVSGGSGVDDVTGGPGRDSLYGGDDNDILDSADGLRDNAVSCGPGRDIAFVDRPDIRGDRVRNCEEVHRIATASLSTEQYRRPTPN
jgi:Ca2+-binding RTX toxin-like protein